MNLEAVYGDGVRSAAAALTIDPLPVGPAKFSDLYGLAPTGEVQVDRDCYIDRPDIVCQQVRVLAGVTLDARQYGLTLNHPQARMVCLGTIDQRQPDPAVGSFFQFRGIDEASYVGGDDGAHTDPGFQLHGPAAVWLLAGAPRTRRTRSTAPLAAGAVTFTVDDATGWRVGDRIVVAPTQPRTVNKHEQHHDDRAITAITGNTVTVAALSWPHPDIVWPGRTIHPAVINLTSNVGVKGEPGHRTHVMGHHSMPAGAWSNFLFQYVGPRQPAGTNKTAGVLGRYGCHLHHNADSTRGHTIEDGVISECGFQGFWTHASHGVTQRRNVVHNVQGYGFGWDMENGQADASHSYVEEDCVVSYRWAELSNSNTQNSMFAHPLGGIIAADGKTVTERPVRRGAWAFGNWGGGNSAGFVWSDKLNQEPNNVWVAENYTGHNSSGQGTFVWQNDYNIHVIDGLDIANTTLTGLDHGAYRNAYEYRNVRAVSCNPEIELHAAPAAATTYDPTHVQRFAGGSAAVVKSSRHNLPGLAVGQFRDLAIGRLDVMEDLTQDGVQWDFVGCGLTPATVNVVTIHPASVYRVQTAGQAWRITASGVEVIPCFA